MHALRKLHFPMPSLLKIPATLSRNRLSGEWRDHIEKREPGKSSSESSIQLNSHQLKNAPEIFVAVVFDLNLAALITMLNRDVGGKTTS